MKMNKTELSEVMDTLERCAERYSLSEELNFSFKFNEEAETLLIDCKPYHSQHSSKILDVKKPKERILNFALDFLEKCLMDEQDARIDYEIEQEDSEYEEE